MFKKGQLWGIVNINDFVKISYDQSVTGLIWERNVTVLVMKIFYDVVKGAIQDVQWSMVVLMWASLYLLMYPCKGQGNKCVSLA